MRTIFKFELNPFPASTEITLPGGSFPIHVGTQGHVIYVWIELTDPPITPTTVYKFYIVGTGKEVPSDGFSVYIGTVFQGPFVWHVYHGF